MGDTVRSTANRSKSKRLMTVIVSVGLLSVGLLTVAPTVAAHPNCADDAQVERGGHEGELFHVCVDADVAFPEKTVPKVTVDCPTCISPPDVDPDPIPPGPPDPGIEDPVPDPQGPPTPGTPAFDNCIGGTGVCHPSVSEIVRWATSYASALLGWNPNLQPSCTIDCVQDPPTIEEIEDYREELVENWDPVGGDVIGWAQRQADRFSVDTTTVDVVETDTGTTHASLNYPVLDEACQSIYGEDATWSDCDPCREVGARCNGEIETSLAVTRDPSQTTGVLIQTDVGQVFVPSTELA